MMIDEKEMAALKVAAEKYPDVKKLLEFYLTTKKDGVEMIRASLNARLIKLNEEVSKDEADFDNALDKIKKISMTLKKLPKKIVEEPKAGTKKDASKKGDDSSGATVFETEADGNRKGE